MTTKRAPKVSQKPIYDHIEPVEFRLDMEPQPKSSAKVAFKDGHAQRFFSKRTSAAMEEARWRVKELGVDPFPAHVPLKVTYAFYRTKGRWLPKYETFPCRKPDADNLVKLIGDTICPTLVPDDAQFTTVIARKRWSQTGQGYITVRIELDKEETDNAVDSAP